MYKVCVLLIFALRIEVSAGTQHDSGVLYDCAANTLYLLCSVTDNHITYTKSLELLPITKNGNSMSEMNNALRECGYATDARTIRIDDLGGIDTPSVVLHYSQNQYQGMGHYFAIIPHDNKITIYDYPNNVVTYTTDFLISYLKQNGAVECPIIMCRPNGAVKEDKGRHAVTKVETDVVFTEFDKQLLGSVDFGREPEASLVACTFRLVNRSRTAIHVGEVEGDCKCAKIEADRTCVEPGKHCNITISVSLVKRYEDVAVRGRAVIRNSDGSKATNVLMLVKGYSEPRVLCKPQRLDFKVMDSNSGTAAIRGVRIVKTRHSGRQSITRIKPTAAHVRIDRIKTYETSTEFDVIIDSTDAMGLSTSRINVYLDDESEPATYVDVVALFHQEFAISPRAAIVRPGEKSRVIITAKGKECVIEKVRACADVECFDVECGDGDDYGVVYVSVDDTCSVQQALTGVVEVSVRVKDTDKQEVLKIPVTYIPSWCVGSGARNGGDVSNAVEK